MKTADLMDAAKAGRPGGVRIPSDYALAHALSVTPQVVSDWRAGRKHPTTVYVFFMSILAGLNPSVVTADLEAERAEAEGKEKRAAAWRWIAEKVGGTAAAVVVGTALIGPSPAESSSVARTYGDSSGQTLYIMSTRRRAWRAMVDALAGFVSGPRMRLA